MLANLTHSHNSHQGAESLGMAEACLTCASTSPATSVDCSGYVGFAGYSSVTLLGKSSECSSSTPCMPTVAPQFGKQYPLLVSCRLCEPFRAGLAVFPVASAEVARVKSLQSGPFSVISTIQKA